MTHTVAWRGSASARLALPLLMFVALVPTATQGKIHVSSAHDTARLIQLGCLLVAALVFGWRQWVPAMSHPVPRPGVWGLAGVLAIASTAAAAVPAVAARELAMALGLAGIVAVTADGLGPRDLPRAQLAVLAGCTGYAVLLWLLTAAPLVDGSPMTWNDVAVGYDNYRLFNHTQTVAIPLLALLAVNARRWSLPHGAAWFALCTYMTYVWCSGARGTALALVLAVGLGWITLGARAVWPLARHLVLAGVVGVAGGALLLAALGGRTMASLSSDGARLQLWQIAWDQIVASPWLGVGPMHYAHYPNPKAGHPHNMYLQVAAEWGLPMLLLVCGAIVIGLARLRRAVLSASSEPARREGAALFVTCVAILADAFVSGNAVMPISQMWIALCLAWTIAWMRAQAGPPTAPPPQGQRLWAARLAGLAVAAAMGWLVVTVWPEAVDLKAHLEHVRRDLVGNAKTNPRFWSHGWF